MYHVKMRKLLKFWLVYLLNIILIILSFMLLTTRGDFLQYYKKIVLIALIFSLIISVFIFFSSMIYYGNRGKNARRIYIDENNNIVFITYVSTSSINGNTDIQRKCYIIYNITTLKITKFYIKISGKINAPNNKLKIPRIFENEDDLINELKRRIK